ncbi:MAG: hypothetical protein HC906_12805 [Bacteroidales bacterium]|nr:hypothetical protein [Bacteroidales bacterium]
MKTTAIVTGIFLYLTIIQIKSQPADSIFIDSNEICSNTISFTRDSINLFSCSFYGNTSSDVISWNWDFGDGSTSNILSVELDDFMYTTKFAI